MKCDKCGAPVTYREHHPIGLPARYDLPEQIKVKDELIKELEAIPRCPCGGELEGLGYDRREKEVVFECKKCHAQILLQNDVWEQALKGGYTLHR